VYIKRTHLDEKYMGIEISFFTFGDVEMEEEKM
jgi:hypothetical protein